MLEMQLNNERLNISLHKSAINAKISKCEENGWK